MDKWAIRIKKIFFILVMISGMGMVSYLWISQWYNQKQVTYLTANTDQMIEEMGQAEIERIRSEADAFNQELLEVQNRWNMPEDMKDRYYGCLDVSNTGLMGVIEIPKLDVQIPIYHGSAGKVLQVGAGHMEGSSLPVGGQDTHAVLAAHTGLASAELFTKLDQMELGDVFYIHVLQETLAYQVASVKTVLPTEVEYLAIEPGEDLVTLVTCTPPGINSHRLLVKGQRIETGQIDVQEKRANSWNYAELYLVSGILILMGVIGYVIRKNLKRK